MPSDNQLQPAILLKTGEIFLKGDNRPAFINILIGNIKDLIQNDFPRAKLDGRVGKFLVSGYGHDAALIEKLKKVFGINLIEEVFVCPPEIEAIKNASFKIMKTFAGAESFKVESRRAWKKFPLISTEINRIVGDLIVSNLGMNVNLSRPAITLKVQVDSNRCFLSVSSHRGACGLPVGCSGTSLLLLSGGIDSPVAGWFAMRRGLHIECIHFHSPPYTGSAVTKKVEDIMRVLLQYDPEIILHTVNFTEAQEIIRDNIREDYRVVMYRWAMVKISSRLGRDRGHTALVTGENLGQVASQTIQNMACVEKASGLPLIRPLITYDKADTINRAREIGTYEISIRKAEDCCSLFVPRHPTTKAHVDVCRKYDQFLEERGIYDQCLAGIKFHNGPQGTFPTRPPRN